MKVSRTGRNESEAGVSLCTIIIITQKIRVTVKMFKSSMKSWFMPQTLEPNCLGLNWLHY